MTKRRRTSGGGDPDITLPGATNSNGHVTNSVTQAASCHADSHVTPSERGRGCIENNPVFSLLSPAPSLSVSLEAQKSRYASRLP